MPPEGQRQSLQLTKDIRVSDQIVIGFAEKHGLEKHLGNEPERMINPRYIQEARSFYHTLEHIEGKAQVVPQFNQLLVDAAKISLISDPIKRLQAIGQYIETGKLPEDLAA